MATTLQFRRGTAAEAAAFTGAAGELFVDTENNTVFIHDGVTPGGTQVSGAGGGVSSDGNFNVFAGDNSGALVTSGARNTSLGHDTLAALTTGNDNVAIGYGASRQLIDNTTSYGGGVGNVVIGSKAHFSGAKMSYTVAIGQEVMTSFNNPDYGYGNTAVGAHAMRSTNYAYSNTAVGRAALRDATMAYSNTVMGNYAMVVAQGSGNTAIGGGTLRAASGSSNAALGGSALYNVTSGRLNTGLGVRAGYTLTTGENNSLIGYNAAPSSVSVNNEITLGNSNITNLRCNDTTISALSDVRDKENIEDIPYGLDFINSLRPVKFSWKRRDGSFEGRVDLGFIAQELDEVEDQFGSHDYTRLVHKENPDRWEADPLKTYPILVKAVQELSAELELLKNQLNT